MVQRPIPGLKYALAAALLVLGGCSTPSQPVTDGRVCARKPLDRDTPEVATVFMQDHDDYKVYRIPSLIATPDGTLLAFAEGRPTIGDPGTGGIAVVLKRSTDCGASWSALTVVDSFGDDGDASNPTAVVAPDADGKTTVWLFYNKRPGTGSEFDLPPGTGADSSNIWLRTSTDAGLTWSKPRNLTADVKPAAWKLSTMGPGIGIVTRRGAHPGRMIVPGWWTDDAGPAGSFVLLSDDQGATFRLGGQTERRNDEAQVIELADGTVLMDARQIDLQEPRRQIYRSTDGGETWSTHTPGLRMTPAMSSLLRLTSVADGDAENLLLHSGVAPDGRNDLRVWYSRDEAKSWTDETILHKGFVQYSVLSKLDDGTVGVLYEAFGEPGGQTGFSILFRRLTP